MQINVAKSFQLLDFIGMKPYDLGGILTFTHPKKVGACKKKLENQHRIAIIERPLKLLPL